MNLIQDYLRSRKQRVVLNGQTSSWEKDLASVSEGSVLGPFNDIPERMTHLLMTNHFFQLLKKIKITLSK